MFLNINIMNDELEQEYWARFDYESELYSEDVESLKNEAENYLLEEVQD